MGLGGAVLLAMTMSSKEVHERAEEEKKDWPALCYCGPLEGKAESDDADDDSDDDKRRRFRHGKREENQ